MGPVGDFLDGMISEIEAWSKRNVDMNTCCTRDLQDKSLFESPINQTE